MRIGSRVDPLVVTLLFIYVSLSLCRVHLGQDAALRDLFTKKDETHTCISDAEIRLANKIHEVQTQLFLSNESCVNIQHCCLSQLRHEMMKTENEDFRILRQEVENTSDRLDRQVALLDNSINLMENRRNNTRELTEKQVEMELATMRTAIAELENRLVRYAIGTLGTLSVVGLGVARLLM